MRADFVTISMSVVGAVHLVRSMKQANPSTSLWTIRSLVPCETTLGRRRRAARRNAIPEHALKTP
jgi:hypothetical protein